MWYNIISSNMKLGLMMHGKNKLNAMKTKYIKVPQEIFHIKLPAYSLALYTMMASYAEHFHPSIRFLAKQLQVSPSTIQRNIKILEQRNIIYCKIRGGINTFSEYQFNDPSLWIR